MNLLRPSLAIKSITDLDIGRLKRLGVRRLIIDKDDTLCPHRGLQVSQAVAAFLPTLLKQFDNKVFVLSNSAQLLQNQWQGLRVLKPNPSLFLTRKKPFNLARVVRGFQEEEPGLLPCQVCMVGDRLLTDVLGANLAGCLSVLVSEFQSGFESHGARLYFMLRAEKMLKDKYY